MALRILSGSNGMLAKDLGDLAGQIKLRTGDTVVEDVAVGRAVFEQLITQGYSAFTTVDGAGRKLEVFEPEVEIVMTRPIAGG